MCRLWISCSRLSGEFFSLQPLFEFVLGARGGWRGGGGPDRLAEGDSGAQKPAKASLAPGAATDSLQPLFNQRFKGLRGSSRDGTRRSDGLAGCHVTPLVGQSPAESKEVTVLFHAGCHLRYIVPLSHTALWFRCLVLSVSSAAS